MWSEFKKQYDIPNISAEEIDQKLRPVLTKMEERGIKLDVSAFKNLAQKLEQRLLELEKEIHRLSDSDFNISSPSQMAEILYQKLGLPTNEIKKTKSGFSTAAPELAKLVDQHPIIKPILECRELSKLVNTYLLPLPEMVDEYDRLHTHYGSDTSTGRLTSNNPNLQNIPIKGDYGNEIRKGFIAEKGNLLISADYSQIELRVAACLANDEAMINSFRKGEDIHSRTAAEIFNIEISEVKSQHRRVAKTVNFGILYGQSPFGLSRTLGIDQKEASEYIKKYFEVHTGIKKYFEEMISKARTDGCVETLFGFKRFFPNINSHIRPVAEGENRMAINTPVQGTAAEILKLAMIELESKIQSYESKIKPQLLLTIHDEVIVECSESDAKDVARMIKEVMESAITLCVPMEAEVEVGPSWGEMEVVK